jgi:hypothetical protein
METLLPPNRTEFEEAADLMGSHSTALSVDVPSLVRPYEISQQHLPWLAWGLSVDLWDKGWPEEKKRSRTARSLIHHSIKGTEAGISEALRVMDAEPLRYIVPPSKPFLSPRFSEKEREQYLARFAQLRVRPFVARGLTGKRGCFLSTRRSANEVFLGPVNPVSLQGTRHIRTASIWDHGEERQITIRTVKPEDVGSFEAIQYDEVVIGAKPTSALHLGGPVKPRSFLVDDYGVRERLVRIPRSDTYSYRLGREQYTTHLPENRMIDIRPQYVAEKHSSLKGAVFPGGGGQRVSNGFLPPSIAWQFLYERWHLHDPDRVPEERKRSTHIGNMRLGMPAYHAEVLTRISGRQYPRTAGRFVNGFLVTASRKPIENAREAIMISKSLRDKILIDTMTYRLPKAGDRHDVATIKVGEYIEV